MSLIQGVYSELRLEMKTGDTLAFGGTSTESKVIKGYTKSEASHIGIVLAMTEAETKERINMIIESTSLNGFAGVTLRFLSEAIEAYDGKVWWLPMHGSIRYNKYDIAKAYKFIRAQQGKLYDTPQAIKSALDTNFPFISDLVKNTEDFSKLFCSEFDIGQKNVGGAIDNINASECTPKDVCSFTIHAEDYYQLKGEPTEIEEYRTVNPEGFGL